MNDRAKLKRACEQRFRDFDCDDRNIEPGKQIDTGIAFWNRSAWQQSEQSENVIEVQKEWVVSQTGKSFDSITAIKHSAVRWPREISRSGGKQDCASDADLAGFV